MTAQDYADFLKILGDKTRLSMLKIMESTECCVCHFADIFDMSQSAISQHMKRLKMLGIVNEERRSQWIYYSLDREHVNYQFIRSILEQVPDHLVMTDEVQAVLENMSC